MNKPVGLIPPTYDVLRQHTLRAAYQAGQIWGRSLDTDIFSSPAEWGWMQDGEGRHLAGLASYGQVWMWHRLRDAPMLLQETQSVFHTQLQKLQRKLQQ